MKKVFRCLAITCSFVMMQSYEEQIDKIEQYQSSELYGGITYAMTLDQMGNVIKEALGELKNRGLIILATEFEAIKDRYYVQAPKHPSTDLTRVWGAQYLKRKINASEYLRDHYDVPEFVIVVNDLHHMQVVVLCDDHVHPVVKELKSAKIYFKTVSGTKAAFWCSQVVQDLGIQSDVKYNDFNDTGNILYNQEINKKYIVDTELKSFFIKKSHKHEPLFLYAKQRFLFLHGYDVDTFKALSFQLTCTLD